MHCTCRLSVNCYCAWFLIQWYAFHFQTIWVWICNFFLTECSWSCIKWWILEDKRKRGGFVQIFMSFTTFLMQWTFIFLPDLVNKCLSLYNHVPSFSSPSYEYLSLPWADISFSCILESVLICEQLRRNSKVMCCCKCLLFYIELYYIYYSLFHSFFLMSFSVQQGRFLIFFSFFN